MSEDKSKEKKKNPFSAHARGKQIADRKQKMQEQMDEVFEPETRRHSRRTE